MCAGQTSGAKCHTVDESQAGWPVSSVYMKKVSLFGGARDPGNRQSDLRKAASLEHINA